MSARQIVVVGASSGGIEALRALAAELPSDFPAPICIVLHTSPHSPGLLPEILNRVSTLGVEMARSGRRLQRGRVYVAPPDCHLLVEPGRLRVTRGPRENGFRPAIDPLFRSAARVHGPATIGVVLTGNMDDGTAGLWAVKQLGGIAIVQDPEDALFPALPRNAMQHVNVDHVVPLRDIAPLLTRLVATPVEHRGEITVPDHLDVEVRIANEQNALDAGLERIAEPSTYACPECHGVLFQLSEGGRLRFRCHTGHAYSVDSLLAAIGEATQDSLWNCVRALEEGALLIRQMADHVKACGTDDDGVSRRLNERGEEARRQSDAVRKLIIERTPLTVPSS